MSFTIEYIGAAWCVPCRTVKPQATTIAHKYAIPFRAIDYDSLDEEEQAMVQKLPTLRILDDATGALLLSITTNHVSALEQWVKDHVTLRVNEDADF